MRTVPNTESWIRGDAYAIHDNSASCDGSRCKRLPLIGNESVASIMYFLDGKLALAEIVFSRNSVKDPYSGTFYDELRPALQDKFKAECKSKDTELPGFTRLHKISMRVAGWRNSSTKDIFELQDNFNFTFSNGGDDNHLLIRMRSDGYMDVVKNRINVVNDFEAKKEAAEEQLRKQDM